MELYLPLRVRRPPLAIDGRRSTKIRQKSDSRKCGVTESYLRCDLLEARFEPTLRRRAVTSLVRFFEAEEVKVERERRCRPNPCYAHIAA